MPGGRRVPRRPAARPGSGHLFRPDRVVDVVAALAAQLLGVFEAEELEPGGPRIELAGELARFVPIVHVGRDLGRDPARDRSAELLVLVCEGGDERTAPEALTTESLIRGALWQERRGGARTSGHERNTEWLQGIRRPWQPDRARSRVRDRAAFATLMQALVVDLVTPIVAAIFGEPSFANLSFTINGSEFLYGHFLNALLTFVSIAAAVYFFVILPYRSFRRRRASRRDEGVRALPLDDSNGSQPLCLLHF